MGKKKKIQYNALLSKGFQDIFDRETVEVISVSATDLRSGTYDLKGISGVVALTLNDESEGFWHFTNSDSSIETLANNIVTIGDATSEFQTPQNKGTYTTGALEIDISNAILQINQVATNRYDVVVSQSIGQTIVDNREQQNYEKVVDVSLVTPPTTPVTDGRYIVAGLGGLATGAWVGQENNFARWDSASYVFVTAVNGDMVYSANQRAHYIFKDGAWEHMETNLSENITQVAHGFTATDLYAPLYLQSSGTWTQANASNESTLADGVITKITNADNFTITYSGEIHALSHGVALGYHWLGNTDGSTTTTYPTTGINQMIYKAVSDDALIIYNSNYNLVNALGFNPDFATLTNLGGSNTGWYNLITWSAVTAPDVSHIDLDLFLTSPTTNAVITFSVLGTVIRGVDDPNSNDSITLSQVIEEGNVSLADTQFRFVRADQTDVNSALMFQMNFDSGRTWNGTMSSNLLVNYEAGTVFGAGTLHTDTANQEIVVSIDTVNWRDQGVIQGSTGGIATKSIGAHANEIAWIDFENETVDLHAEATVIGRFSKIGTRLSAGEYGSWTAPTSTDWLFDATYWTNLIAEKRLTSDDTTLNPSSSITLSAIDNGGTNVATMTGFDAAHRGLRFTTSSGTRGLAITFANCLFQRIQFTMTFGTATSSGGTTQDYEIVDTNNNQLMSFDIPASNNDVGDVNTFVFEFTSGNGDTQVILRKRSTGTSQTVYLFNYSLTVFVDEPALEANTVLQLDSPMRGFLPPRIIPTTSANHPEGTIALNGLADNRPIIYDGEDWAYFNTTRINFSSVDTGQFFFAEGNTLADSGWTGSNMVRWVNTLNHQGFPEVIRITQTGGTVTAKAPNNTQALWDTARANGFRVDFRMMFGATHDGQIWADIEPNNTSWGSNGRFEFNVTVTTGQLQITMINTGGNTTFDIDRDVMHTISMICPPNSDVAEIHLEGSKIGEVTYGGGGTTDRGTFFYIPPGNAVNDMSIQSVTMYTMDTSDLDVTLDKKAITTGLRYNVPNVNSAIILRVPKGLYDFGNTFTIVNGSTEPCIVKGLDDDHQLFGGVSEYEVLPQKEVTFTETGFPRGNVWAVEGGKTVINHDDNTSTGNTLILTIDGSGNITGRHGTYLGAVTTTRVTTGQYSINAGTVLFDDATSVIATPKHTAGQQMTCNYGVSIGNIIVDVLQAGTAVNDGFSVEIYW
ncbi:DUF2793 domain-containing protein [Aquimarina algiphila]|uniref:DUF2793 domain-containing protein n=1 Tax=Aquimarina algiphila TaxID=2047982 RepID=A0A554VRM7_9FLAO|nr:DUF2793 domain-containing protein [Aquimarina algiphila]TSE11296.1 DUF2793 domain-containing protein [Aquimarina algiphila]